MQCMYYLNLNSDTYKMGYWVLSLVLPWPLRDSTRTNRIDSLLFPEVSPASEHFQYSMAFILIPIPVSLIKKPSSSSSLLKIKQVKCFRFSLYNLIDCHFLDR